MAREKEEAKVKRPFHQPAITERDAKLIPFRGRAFRFYLLLPRRRGQRIIFSAVDARDLFNLLTHDFGGCTRSDVEKSPVFGSWEMREHGKYEVVVDVHSEFTVYTKPTAACKRYFARLESNLRQHLLRTRGIHEEQIMIEMTEVEIIAGSD